MSKNVLLIGRNPIVLANLASALLDEGVAVKTTNRVEQASQEFNAADFELIAFGRGVDEATNKQLKTAFLSQNGAILFVDGLAPVIPLLVRQIKLALAGKPTAEKILTHFTCQLTEPLRIYLTTTLACELRVELYQLDAVHQTQQTTLVSEFVSAGNHTFVIAKLPDTTSSINFLVAEVANADLTVLPLQ